MQFIRCSHTAVFWDPKSHPTTLSNNVTTDPKSRAKETSPSAPSPRSPAFAEQGEHSAQEKLKTYAVLSVKREIVGEGGLHS